MAQNFRFWEAKQEYHSGYKVVRYPNGLKRLERGFWFFRVVRIVLRWFYREREINKFSKSGSVITVRKYLFNAEQ